MTELIYDVGMHEGEDSKFYLLKGFRVVGVEADCALCEGAAARLGQFITTGQLTIVNRAIAPERGPVTFYRSARSGWGTIVSQWSKDNAALGAPSEPIEVEATVTTALPNAMFKLRLDNSEHEILGIVSGKMRKHFIRILPGDRVKVQLSPYDLTKGRIVFRQK